MSIPRTVVSVCAALLLIGGAAPLPAATASRSRMSEGEALQVERAFERRQTATATYRAAVRQEVGMAGMRDPIVSEGLLFYKKPGCLRINFSRPPQDYVLLREGNLVARTKGKITERNLETAPGGAGSGGTGMLLDFFRGGGARFKEDYTRTIFRGHNFYEVVLERKQEQRGWPSRIEVSLDQPTLEVRALLLCLPGKTTLLFEFSQVSRGIPLDAQLFDAHLSR